MAFHAHCNKSLSVNSRIIFSGGKREAPILLSPSRDAGFTIRDYNWNFETRLDDYARLDIGISWKVNRAKSTSTIAINVQNAIGRANEFGRF